MAAVVCDVNFSWTKRRRLCVKVTQNSLTYSFIKAPIRLCTHYKGIEPRLPTYNDFMLMGMLNATHSLTHFRHGSFGMWLCGSTINSPCLANITKAVVTPLTWYLRRSDTHSATVHSWSLVHRRAIHYPPNISLSFLRGYLSIHFSVGNIGSRAFPVAGARIWNTLPLHIASASSLTVFKQRFKLHLFWFSFPGLSPVWLLTGPCSVCCHLGHYKNWLIDWLIN